MVIVACFGYKRGMQNRVTLNRVKEPSTPLRVTTIRFQILFAAASLM